MGARNEPPSGGKFPELQPKPLQRWRRGIKLIPCSASARQSEAEVPAEIDWRWLEARQAARKAKDFKRADAIRDELKAKGWVIEDTPKGPKLKKI